MKIWRLCLLVIYYGIACHLPASDTRFGLWARYVRRWVCKPLFDQMGTAVNVEKGVHFGSGAMISIGDYSGIGIDCRINGPVSIGRHVMMGPDVTIVARGHQFDRTDIPMRLQDDAIPKPVIIDDDVWIGTRVILLPGVHIGTGAIIGAGSVVTKNVEAYAIVGGNPAQVIKRRRVGTGEAEQSTLQLAEPHQ